MILLLKYNKNIRNNNAFYNTLKEVNSNLKGSIKDFYFIKFFYLFPTLGANISIRVFLSYKSLEIVV